MAHTPLLVVTPAQLQVLFICSLPVGGALMINGSLTHFGALGPMGSLHAHGAIDRSGSLGRAVTFYANGSFS